MSFLQLSLAYFWWHYTAAWADLWRLFTNLSWFLFHFFSIEILCGTLFAPWKRLHESGRGRGSGGVAGRLIINLMTRLVGFLMRTGTIVLGLFSLLLFTVVSALFFVAWLFLPLVAIGLILNGGVGLFSQSV